MFLVSVLYWAWFVLTLPILFVPALVIFVITAPFDRRRITLHLYTCFWAQFLLASNPMWRVRVVGSRKIPWRKPVVIASNHASLIDILVLLRLYRPYRWVSKIENFKLPIIGWLMHLDGYVPLVRGNRESVVKMMEQCRALLRAGNSLMMFPEGTRSKTGELQPFKAGAFQLAAETGVPVIPVAVHGTHESLPKHGLILRDRMDAVVEVLDPIDPADFATVEDLSDATRAVIEDALKGHPPPALERAV